MLLELDLDMWGAIAANCNVLSTPSFVIGTAEGEHAFEDPAMRSRVQLLIANPESCTLIGDTAEFGATDDSTVMANPFKVAHGLLRIAANRALDQKAPSVNPYVAAALADALDSTGEGARADALVDQSVACERATEAQKRGLLTLRAQRRLVSGNVEGGLADLSEAYPKLSFTSAGEGRFAVASGGVGIATMSAARDIQTLCTALDFAARCEGTVPDPARALAEDQVALLAFAWAAENDALMDEAVKAVGTGYAIPEERFAQAAFLVSMRLAETSEDYAMLFGEMNALVARYPGEPFTPDVVAAMVDVSRRRNDAAKLTTNWDIILGIIGHRVPVRLKDRIPTSAPGEWLPPRL